MLKKLEKEDRADFIALSEEFYASPAVLHGVPRSHHERAFEELMRSDAYICCYLLYDGAAKDVPPAGYALLQKTYSREAGGFCYWIDEIYVRPAFRGRGLAKELFAFADGLHGARLRLEAEPDNERAIKLYRALGFQPLPYVQMIKESP